MNRVTPQNLSRCKTLIQRAIREIELDLSGAVVLTEAASNNYMLTPLIAALAGATHVFAVGRNSSWGKINEIETSIQKLAGDWGVSGRISILENLHDLHLRNVDLITNLGFVRPIGVPLLDMVSHNVVIPLMWETWEFRHEDIDIYSCHARGIPVLGTDEQHPLLHIFNYIGLIAMKLLWQCDIEIIDCSIAVLGDGQFAEITLQALEQMGAEVVSVSSEQAKTTLLQGVDAIVVINHPNAAVVMGSPTGIDISQLCADNPGVVCVHISGGMNAGEIRAANLRVVPPIPARPGYMSYATDFLGPRPLIYLHTAGLKVGQAMREAVSQGLRGKAAEQYALQNCSFAQAFPEDFIL